MIELLEKYVYINNKYYIKEFYTEMGNIRILFSDECIQSLMFVEDGLRNKLSDFYFSLYDIPLYLNSNGSSYLVLGGGVFTYPKHYISSFLDKNMTVVEKDLECINIAKKYFYLDELISNFDSKNERLNIVIDDAIHFINNCNDKYNYILIDLFNGKEMVHDIFLENNLNKIKSIINEDSVVIINYLINENNKNSYKDELFRLTHTLKYYKLVSHESYFNIDNCIGNFVVVLSNNEINIPDIYDYIELNNLII